MFIIFNETLEIVSLKVGLHELGLLIHKIKQAIITWERFHCCTVIGQVTKNLSPLYKESAITSHDEVEIFLIE